MAVKTGTTQELKDAWVIGYTSSVVVGAWAGNNDGTPTLSLGAILTAPAWNQVMRKSLELYPPKGFVKPNISGTERITLEDLMSEQDPQYKSWQKAINPWLEKQN